MSLHFHALDKPLLQGTIISQLIQFFGNSPYYLQTCQRVSTVNIERITSNMFDKHHRLPHADAHPHTTQTQRIRTRTRRAAVSEAGKPVWLLAQSTTGSWCEQYAVRAVRSSKRSRRRSRVCLACHEKEKELKIKFCEIFQNLFFHAKKCDATRGRN